MLRTILLAVASEPRQVPDRETGGPAALDRLDGAVPQRSRGVTARGVQLLEPVDDVKTLFR